MVTDPLTLRSVGLAYRQLSARLTAEWARVAALDAPHFAQDGPNIDARPFGGASGRTGFYDALFALQVLEETARGVFGAKGCPEGKAGCQPGAVRNCDACCIVEGTV